MESRIKYLESKLPKEVKLNDKMVSIDEKYQKKFERYATYLGNGIYQWKGIIAKDTAELFAMGVLLSEKIPFKQI